MSCFVRSANGQKRSVQRFLGPISKIQFIGEVFMLLRRLLGSILTLPFINGSAQECVKGCILPGFRENTYLAQKWSELRFCSQIGWFAVEMTHQGVKGANLDLVVPLRLGAWKPA